METFEIEKYKEMALRRFWWVIIPLLLAILTGIGLSLRLPRMYRAGTLILVQRQKVPETYIREIVSIDLEDRLYSITQQISSRSNLEKIIKEFDLYRDDSRYTFMEDKVGDLRSRIEVEIAKKIGRRETNSFQIFFTGKSPQRVARVANALTSFFITENLRLREDQAMSTADFLKEELETFRNRLVEKEEELKRYREKYMGGLPEQLDTNLKILERIQQQLDNNQENLREAENRRLLLQQQLAEAEEMGKGVIISARGPEGKGQPVTLEDLKEQLAFLESRYTQRHPDLIRLKDKISEMESKKEGKSGEGEGKEEGLTQAERNLQNQLRETEFEIKTLKGEATQLRSQIKRYQAMVEDTPKREQELMSLKRDYDNIMRTYDSLLGRKLEAELAVNMERKQKGEQFRILDTARVPTKPFKPNIPRVLFMSVALGFALGFGLAFLRETMDTSFKSPEEVENELQLPVLISMPVRYTRKELRSIKRKKILAFASVAVGFILSAAGIVFAFNGMSLVLGFIKDIVARI